MKNKFQQDPMANVKIFSFQIEYYTYICVNDHWIIKGYFITYLFMPSRPTERGGQLGRHPGAHEFRGPK
jgi:hypothetical protein